MASISERIRDLMQRVNRIYGRAFINGALQRNAPGNTEDLRNDKISDLDALRGDWRRIENDFRR